MKLSQNIAGVTFLAFGNGAPDVFSAIAAVGNAKDGDAGLAFGALFGAGVFVSTVIVGLICFISPFHSVQRPLLRDIVFFMIAGFWAFYVIWDGEIQLWETLGFLFMYGVYIFVVLFGRYINQKIKRMRGISASINDFSSERAVIRSQNAPATNSGLNREEEEEEEYENENITRPLLTKTNVHELPDVQFSKSSSLIAALMPFEAKDWRESNFLFKFMILVKVNFLFVFEFNSEFVFNFFLYLRHPSFLF